MKKRLALASLMIFVVLLMGHRTAILAPDDISKKTCGGVIAEIGDQQYAFEQKCGLPTATEQNGRIWIYDRRPDDFVYYVTFTKGQVERIPGGDD